MAGAGAMGWAAAAAGLAAVGARTGIFNGMLVHVARRA